MIIMTIRVLSHVGLTRSSRRDPYGTDYHDLLRFDFEPRPMEIKSFFIMIIMTIRVLSHVGLTRPLIIKMVMIY
jgi:hypothetical protein